MTNTAIIKQYLAPLLIPKEDNKYKEVFLNAYKTSFANSMSELKHPIFSSDLEGMSFFQAVSKYSPIINEWTPEKSLNVFWIRGIKVYTFNQYEVIKAFFKKYNESMYNELMNIQSKNALLNNELLIKLAMNNDLSEDQYKDFETKNINFVKNKAADINYFKKLVKIGKLYHTNIIWESYLEYYQKNQIFINNVKDFFDNENISYNFFEEELNIFTKNKYTRTLYVNSEYVCKYNKNITASLLDEIIQGISDYYIILAKKIDSEVEAERNYIKAGNRGVMIHFEECHKLAVYDTKIEDFNKYLKKIVAQLQVQKDKKSETYKEEIDKLYLYCKMQDKYDNKQIEKRSKI